MSVSDHHPDYDKFKPMWDMCSDTVEGQTAIHAKGELYLPKLTDEDPKQYKARVARSDFFNATWRTIAGLTGMAFNKPPTTDLPAALDAYTADINMAGVSLDALARDLVEDVQQYGRVGLMVDFPPAPENVVGLTLAAYESLGLRPKIVTYAAEHIINWRFKRVRNSWVLAMVVITENASIATDEFSHKTETRYRVLDLDEAGAYRQRMFRINEKNNDEQIGGDIYPVMKGRPLGFIPFSFIGVGGKADHIDMPPMIDLIAANIAHYQINADYRHGLHFTGLPTPVITGYTPEAKSEKFYIGSLSAWVFPDPNAKASYLEFHGQGLTEIRAALDNKVKEMATLGARMIADETRHMTTLGEAQIKHAGENSILAAVVIAVSEAMEWALGVFSEWIGASGKIVYQINREFMPAPLDAQMLVALTSSMQAGGLSDREYYQALQRGDVIDGQKDYELHQAEIDAAPAMARPMPAVPMPIQPDKQAA
jgi:hypothetical protein